MALYLGAIPTALAYVLFARGLRHLTPGETATLTLAEPLTATGLGILVLERAARRRRRGRRRASCSPACSRSPRPRARAAPRPEPVAGARMNAKFAIERVSTVDAVAASLRTRILDGDLPPGERLREIELTEGYGVARHSLRAALRQLQAEGLVTIEPNRGARVAELTELEPLSSCARRSRSRPPAWRSSATAAGCPRPSTTPSG